MLLDSGTNSILEEARFIAKASSSDLPKADIVRLGNQALDRLNSLVLGVEHPLQYDDENHSDAPVVSFAFTNGTATYDVFQDGDGDSVLDIAKFLIPTPQGGTQRQIVTPATIDDDRLVPYLQGTISSGIPLFYRRTGRKVTLYPTPNYSGTGEVHVRRNMRYFTTSDTAVAPGFAAPFHRLVPLWIAYWWCVREGKTRTANSIFTEIQLLEAEFIEYYGDAGTGDRITPKYRDPR